MNLVVGMDGVSYNASGIDGEDGYDEDEEDEAFKRCIRLVLVANPSN